MEGLGFETAVATTDPGSFSERGNGALGDGQIAASTGPASRRLGSGGGAPWFDKLVKMMGGASEGFVPILPDREPLGSPRSIAVDGPDRLFVYSAGRLLRLDRPAEGTSGRWTLSARYETEWTSANVWLRRLNEQLVLIRSDGPPMVFSDDLQRLAIDLSEVWEGSGLQADKIQEVITCPEIDSLVALDQTGRIWSIGFESDRRLRIDRSRLARGVEALHWNAKYRQLWVAHRVDAIRVIQMPSANAASHRIVADYHPSPGAWRLVDRYLITPLRYLTPQTGELGETIASVVSGQSSVSIAVEREGTGGIQQYNVWRPVITCAVFMVVILLVSCLYFTRADF